MSALHEIADGTRRPPAAVDRLGVGPLELEPGHATIRLQPAPIHDNGYGIVHGGVLATLLDTVMGCAVQTAVPADAACVTAELKTTFLRPVSVDAAEVIATGTVVQNGRRVVFAEGEIVDASGTKLATASSTYLVLDAVTEAGASSTRSVRRRDRGRR